MTEPRRIRILTRDNGAGLTRDMHVVRDVLREAGHAVECVGFGKEAGINSLRELALRAAAPLRPRVDVQVFLERVYPRLLPLARRNVLIPNPEWFPDAWHALVPRFDAVLCKTHHAVPLFQALGGRAQYVGFTGADRLDASVPRERAFLHVAGRSSAKGTGAVIDAWRRHPEWPRLTIVQSASKASTPVRAPNIDHRIGHIDDTELRRLQNAHLFHLQPSEMEGFGHVLVEAMSTGNVVITTDGAPMNELVTRERGLLVAPARTSAKDLATRFHVDADALEPFVHHAMALNEAALEASGTAARAWYISNDAAFHAALRGAT